LQCFTKKDILNHEEKKYIYAEAIGSANRKT